MASPEPTESDRTPTAEAGARRSAWRWIRAAAVTVTLFLGYQLVLIFRGWLTGLLDLVMFLVFGAILTFICGPAAAALHRRAGMPRTLAALISLLLLIAVVAGLAELVVGPLVSEMRSLLQQLPGLAQELQGVYGRLSPLLARAGIHLDLNALVKGEVGSLTGHLAPLLITSVTTTVSVVADVVITLVVAFWMLRDGPELRSALLGWLPLPVREPAEFGLDATNAVFGGYVRAQLLMAVLIGGAAGLGCWALGVPFPLVIALAAGLFELIPMVGPFAGGAVAVALALTQSFPLAIYVVIFFVAIHALEGYVIGPRVQARFVRLHPLVTFLALIAGIEVAGFLGALFAVPVASLGAVFIRAAIGDFRTLHPELFAASGSRTDRLREQHRRMLRGFQLLPASTRRRVRATIERAWSRASRR